MKELKGLIKQDFKSRSVERLGCIKGGLDFLETEISFPWLYGGTGHAFIISIDPGVDVSSPDSWDHQPQYDLGKNLGYTIDGFSIRKNKAGDSFQQKQQEAWDFVRTNIDNGIPCFGFELKKFFGGYWLIYGYDDIGYYYSGYAGYIVGGPLPWQELGTQFIPLLEVHSIKLCSPQPKVKIIKDGLTYAIKHATNPPKWINMEAKAGPEAWAYWAEALENGEAKRDHHTYNLMFWLECREMAVEFLKEIKTCLSESFHSVIDETVKKYLDVCDKLKKLIELHPEREKPTWGPDSTFTSPKAGKIVRQIADIESDALVNLKKIVDQFEVK